MRQYPTIQAYYNDIVQRYSDGRLPSRDNLTGCCYRAEAEPHATERCLIGMLIPDDAYDREMEGKSAGEIAIEAAWMPPGMEHVDLDRLQEMHDETSSSLTSPVINSILDDVAELLGIEPQHIDEDVWMSFLSSAICGNRNHVEKGCCDGIQTQ